ncbi:hypothetical protein G7066_05030 [Leucobacter coleopterorum]|uniref:IPT/TIG domain-containing protein n=1 Tax=Leucobacter coleopterorum TaxID=2714933 RepID=A0ABX6JZJ2_9MICO|nr:IPT/TIG domain-containing protein [Leucobacter coleopterorum]QIM18185.1 hypothetical protein G7066_05030 [Leucobacter coleopterorum]
MKTTPVAVDTSGPTAGKTIVRSYLSSRIDYMYRTLQDSDGNLYSWGGPYVLGAGGATIYSSTPVAVLMPESDISVNFGDSPAASIERTGVTSVTAVTPSHVSGKVPVTVRYGDRVFAAGDFTFGTPPVVLVNPKSASVSPGATVRMQAAGQGDETPAVAWQVSQDDGQTWVAYEADAPAALSELETSAELVLESVSAELDGSLFRAVFTNDLGQAVTAEASVTVNENVGPTEKPKPPTVNPGGKDEGENPGGGLPTTGGNEDVVAGIVSVALIGIFAGTIVLMMRKRSYVR